MFSYSKGNTYTLLAKVQAICMQATPAPRRLFVATKHRNIRRQPLLPSSLMTPSPLAISKMTVLRTRLAFRRLYGRVKHSMALKGKLK